MKALNWQAAVDNAAGCDTPEALEEHATQFAVNIDMKKSSKVENGFMQALYVGTGFMMITKSVVEKLCKAFPDLHYKNDISGYNNQYTTDNFWAFFDCEVDPDSKRYLSEDYLFCKRWREACGGEIWVDVMMPLTHTGSYQYRGSFLSWVQRHAKTN